MKHRPFESPYKPDFELVEQRQGKARLFPHTDQLPILLRAINMHFSAGLPPRIARADHRSTGFDKIVLRHASLLFCHWINAARNDELRLYSILDPQLLTRPAIVQQITEDNRLGRFHRFRFYAGADFFPEIYICGKRVAFADHVLQRYSDRASIYAGEDLSTFLVTFFGSQPLAMPVGDGRAFVMDNLGSIMAFPYKETDDEFFITSCLTLNQIHTLELEVPPHTVNYHYDLPFHRPKIRSWLPIKVMMTFYQAWERKIQPREVKARSSTTPPSWHELAYFARDHKKKQGHGPGSEIYYVDGMPGPLGIEALPGQVLFQHDELAHLKKHDPDFDWDYIIAEREKKGTYAPLRK